MADDKAAVDWQSILAKLKALAENAPAILSMMLQVLALFEKQQARFKKALARGDSDCCEQLKKACDDECAAIAALVLAHCKTHALVNGGGEGGPK